MTTDLDNTPTANPTDEQALPPELQMQAMMAEHQHQVATLQQRCATLHANVLVREQELVQLRAEVAELRGANASPTT